MALLLWVITAWAQGRTIAGVVLNATDNEPIIGASVPVKDTQLGASSNIDGELSINFTQKATTLMILLCTSCCRLLRHPEKSPHDFNRVGRETKVF